MSKSHRQNARQRKVENRQKSRNSIRRRNYEQMSEQGILGKAEEERRNRDYAPKNAEPEEPPLREETLDNGTYVVDGQTYHLWCGSKSMWDN